MGNWIFCSQTQEEVYSQQHISNTSSLEYKVGRMTKEEKAQSLWEHQKECSSE